MLGRLFGSKNKPPPPAEAAHLSSQVEQSILHALGLKSIPVMPSAAQQAFQLATNPKAEAHDFIEVIEADEGMSARVLKIANSVFYDRGGGSRTIADAVNVIGMSELRGVLNATALTDLFPSKHRLRAELWSHDIGTALTARILARRLLPSQTDQAFLAGLMHDVGKLLMLHRHSETYEKIALRSSAHAIESTVAEAEEYPFDHTEVGQVIAERWNFTPDLAITIRSHHKPWEDLQPNTLVTLVKGANTITHALGLGSSPSDAIRGFYTERLPQAWEALHIAAPTEQKDLMAEVRHTFEMEYELYASWGSS